MTPNHVTLEPNEYNEAGSALTIYLPDSITINQVKNWIIQNKPSIGSLGVDVNDPYFTVEKTQLQPFEAFHIQRFQAHPTC